MFAYDGSPQTHTHQLLTLTGQQALHYVWSQAIRLAPSSALLYANRAAAYLKRDWVSDSWAALQDCETAIRLDPMFVKAHCRRVHALNALGQLHVSLTQSASGCRSLRRWQPFAQRCLHHTTL